MRIIRIKHISFRNPLDILTRELTNQTLEEVKKWYKNPPPQKPRFPKNKDAFIDFYSGSDIIPNSAVYKSLSFADPRNPEKKYIMYLAIQKSLGNRMPPYFTNFVEGLSNRYKFYFTIFITLCKDFKPADYQDLYLEIKKTIRHETDHLFGQTNLPESSKQQQEAGSMGSSSYKTETEQTLYITSPRETDSFIREYMTEAKFKKELFTSVLRRKLDDNVSAGTPARLFDEIFDSYMKRAKQIYPSIMGEDNVEMEEPIRIPEITVDEELDELFATSKGVKKQADTSRKELSLCHYATKQQNPAYARFC